MRTTHNRSDPSRSLSSSSILPVPSIRPSSSKLWGCCYPQIVHVSGIIEHDAWLETFGRKKSIHRCCSFARFVIGWGVVRKQEVVVGGDADNKIIS